jgi:hypothetical protein
VRDIDGFEPADRVRTHGIHSPGSRRADSAERASAERPFGNYQIGSPEALASGDVQLSGSVVAPAFTGASTVRVSAPFTFSGQLAYPVDGGASTAVEPLSGRGTATLTLTWDSGVWRFG